MEQMAIHQEAAYLFKVNFILIAFGSLRFQLLIGTKDSIDGCKVKF